MKMFIFNFYNFSFSTFFFEEANEFPSRAEEIFVKNENSKVSNVLLRL